MKKRNVNRNLQVKINNYLLYASQIDLAIVDEQAQEIIKILPETIKEDLKIETHQNII